MRHTFCSFTEMYSVSSQPPFSARPIASQNPLEQCPVKTEFHLSSDKMGNAVGHGVDLYIPRKCSAVIRQIAAKARAAATLSGGMVLWFSLYGSLSLSFLLTL